MSSNREANLELSLREHLLLAQNQSGQAASSPPSNPYEPNIDPAIAGSSNQQMSAGDSGGEDAGSDNRKGRRELSTSKRAAQNRAAQRAFRQRKEEYIKSLKDQVKEFETLNESYKAVQAENYALRDYIIQLQQACLEFKGSFPPPPASFRALPLDAQPNAPEVPPMSSSAVNQLVSAAQATEAHANEGANNGQYVPVSEYSSPKRPREKREWSPVSTGDRPDS